MGRSYGTFIFLFSLWARIANPRHRVLDFFYAVQSLPTSHPILYAVPTLPTYSMTCVSCSLEWLRSRETSQSIRILINFHFFKEHFVELGFRFFLRCAKSPDFAPNPICSSNFTNLFYDLC
jgi:hypothetical protein